MTCLFAPSLTHVPVCWKGRYSCPNSQLPPTPLFPLPHPMYSQAGTKNKKQSRIVPCYHPAPLSPVTNGSLLRSGRGVAGSYTPAVRVRVHPRICEASHWLHALPGSPCGMERARLRTIPDTQLHNAEWLFCRAAGVRLSNCCLIHSSSADAYTDGEQTVVRPHPVQHHLKIPRPNLYSGQAV